MAFKLGQKVIWLGNDNQTLVSVIKSGTVTKTGKDTVWVDNQHKSEDCLLSAFLWPDLPLARELCERVLQTKARHEAEETALLKEQFELTNFFSKEGLK